MPYTPPTQDFNAYDDEERKRRAAQAAQAATNSTPTSQLAQQTAQPAGGNVGGDFPRPVQRLARTITGGGTPSPDSGGYDPSQPYTFHSQPSGPMFHTQGGQQATTTPQAPDPRIPGGPRGGQGPGGIRTQDDTWQPQTPGGPPPPDPPATPPPPAATTTNQFGNTANLDPAYLEQQIRAAFSAAGKTPTPEDIRYWIDKASRPDIYSDGQVRVGWNDYWADRIRTGSDSSDPRLAGSAGLIANPSQYGFGTMTGSDGNIYFQNASQNHGNSAPTGSAGSAPAAVPPPGTTPSTGYTPTTHTAPPTAVPTVAPAAQATAPTSTFQYTLPNVQPVTAPASTAPTSVSTYQAGTAPTAQAPTYQAGQVGQFTPADISAILAQLQGMAAQGTGVTAPTYAAGTVDQFSGGAGTSAMNAALAQLLGAGAMVDPNVAGQKEAAKETLLAAQQAQRDAMLGSGAMRGTLGSGAQAALAAQTGDAFAGNLTDVYRTIDADAQQRGLANRLNLGSALTGLGTAQGSENRADYGATLAGQQAQEQLAQMEAQLGLAAGTLTAQLQQQQFGQLANAANMATNTAQSNYTTGLQGTGMQAQMDQAAAASGQAATAQALQAWQAQQAANQAQANSGLAAANYGLNYDQMQQAAAAQQFQQALAAAGLNLQGQQAQAGQGNIENQLGFNYAQLGQQNTQFNQQLEQQAAQAAAQMGFNYAQLSQQDKQYFAQLAQQNAQFGQTFGLNSAIAGNNANQGFINTLLGMF